jgi:phospholipase C
MERRALLKAGLLAAMTPTIIRTKFAVAQVNPDLAWIGSHYWNGAYLRMDGRGVGPSPDGGGTVNCQYYGQRGSWERFLTLDQGDGTVAIASDAFRGVYLRMDGRGVGPSPDGGGTVNCQGFIGSWEKFRILPQPDGTVAIGSVAFPGVFLRMDGRPYGRCQDGCPDGFGTVNCQGFIGSWEKFFINRTF